MTKTEAERIAAAIHDLRPDWPASSVLTLIGKHYQHRPPRDIALALTWIALDYDSRTPGRILENGPWWKTTSTAEDKPTRAPSPRTHETCPIDGHSGWAHNCPQCRADALAATPDLTDEESR